MVKGILAYRRRAFCAIMRMMAWQSMRNGCAKASFNPFLSTFLLFFFHWKPARPDALFCSLGLSLRPSLLALRPAALYTCGSGISRSAARIWGPWRDGRRWSSPQRPGRPWTSSGRRRGDGGSTAGGGFRGSFILPAVPGGDLFLYN